MKTLLFIVSVGTIAALGWRTAPDPEAGPRAGPPVVALSSQSPSPALQIQEHVLDNGFAILVVKDHRAPRVAANLWVRIGSMLEPAGLHGMTHFLEHVIHQGTTTIGTGDLAAELPILQEIHDMEQEFIAVRNRDRNLLRERGVFFDELGWPATPEMRALRERLYELEDRTTSTGISGPPTSGTCSTAGRCATRIRCRPVPSRTIWR